IDRPASATPRDHERHAELGGLEGCEALAALQALAAAADLTPLAGETRVVHLGLLVAAEWAVHAASPLWRALGSVNGEAAAQLQDLGPDALDHCRRAFRIEHLRDEIRHLLHLAFLEAARG